MLISLLTEQKGDRCNGYLTRKRTRTRLYNKSQGKQMIPHQMQSAYQTLNEASELAIVAVTAMSRMGH